ncbi:MAG: asparaginase [Gemmatimonadota bacterium]|nr:MAG: asparaginase [Gemmatimonadota bacterium]
MTGIVVESTRSGVVESVHRVCVAVVRSDGALYARSGDADMVTFMRSTAKPFQALPLVQDGAMERFDITPEELALACASHSSERSQVQVVRRFLARLDLTEGHLACGPHHPLGRSFAVPPLDLDLLEPPSPLASNCSGKHTGMLALALRHGWPTAGYNAADHPVQRRIKRELSRWTGMNESEITEGVDGCTAVSFAIPLTRMALGLARLVQSTGAPEQMVVQAMIQHPALVAGRNRLGTTLMEAYPGKLIVKVGAAGVYLAGLVDRGLGIALKVEDGDAMAAMAALVHVLEQLDLDPPPSSTVPQFAALPVLNTRGVAVGLTRATGGLTIV